MGDLDEDWDTKGVFHLNFACCTDQCGCLSFRIMESALRCVSVHAPACLTLPGVAQRLAGGSEKLEQGPKNPREGKIRTFDWHQSYDKLGELFAQENRHLKVG